MSNSFAPGLTCFLTEAGVDVKLVDHDGTESRTRVPLSLESETCYLSEDGTDAAEVKIVGNDIHIEFRDKSYVLTLQASGKHYFAYLNQWPKKSDTISMAEVHKRLKAMRTGK